MANDIRRFMIRAGGLWFGDTAYMFDGVYGRNGNMDMGIKEKEGMCNCRTEDLSQESTNIIIDITKFLMAILVIGIHTDPFDFNYWLDKVFGIVTRLCVPFFFVASSYFFFNKEGRSGEKYMKRLLILLIIWSLIYLPFDFSKLKDITLLQVFLYYLWNGPEHALWYLSGSLVGFVVLKSLLKLFGQRIVTVIAVVVLFCGCAITTYMPLFERISSIHIDRVNCRNGLFYAFPYMALGMTMAKHNIVSGGGG